MPWCPKCKNEYREGIRVCADCGCELVDTIPVTGKPLMFGDKKQMLILQKFLEYNDLKDVAVEHDADENVYEVYVSEKDWQKAVVLRNVFLVQAEAAKREQEAQNLEQTTEEKAREEEENYRAAMTASNVYMDSAAQAMDSKSSAWVLLLMGGLGILGVILCATGVVSVKFATSALTLDALALLFMIFVVMGAMSIKKAQIFTQKAKTEDSLREAILQWCRENLDAKELDGENGIEAPADAAESEMAAVVEGALYFRRTAVLKQRINHQFLNLDQDFLEHFIDEQIYDLVFGEADR